MTHADFHAAMLADPDDDLMRLVFADWLDEQGEVDRAAFVRLSLELAARGAGPHGAADAWRRAWPVGFGTLGETVSIEPARGLVEFGVMWKRGLTRIKKCRWLAAAVTTGWVGEVTVADCRPNLLALWRETWAAQPAGVPWGASCYDHTTPDVFRAMLECPRLVALRTHLAALPAGVLEQFLALPSLRSVVLNVASLTDSRMAESAALLAVAPHLRRLDIQCTSGRPSQAELLVITRNTAIRGLNLRGAAAHFAPRVTAARMARPDLTIHVWDETGHPVVTP